jgi:DNA polymerase III epsilon subunit-like protein
LEYTHAIVRMERGATKNSGSPMYRCRTEDGQTVNVFQHSDPVKDGSHLFIQAGYMVDMEALKIGEALEWTGSPIRVEMRKKGDWWEVVAVELRPEGVEADTLWKPDVEVYRARAHQQAIGLTGFGDFSDFWVIDLETTGLRLDDEIVAMALVDKTGQIVVNTCIQPKHPAKLDRVGKNGQTASDIHGLTAADLANAPTLTDVMIDLYPRMHGKVLGYNVRFDLQMLDRNLSDNELLLPAWGAVWDVAQLVAEFIGNWNAKRGWFEMVTLDEACRIFGIERDVAHDALADALATLELVKAMADADPETWRNRIEEPF